MSAVEATASKRDTTRAIAERVRRETRNSDLLALCDAVLARTGECPVCAARRFAKAATQRRWRAKKRVSP